MAWSTSLGALLPAPARRDGDERRRDYTLAASSIDRQIRELWSAFGSFVEPAALGRLRQFVKLQKQYKLVGLGLIERIAQERGLREAPSFKDFLTMIANYLDTDEDARELAFEPFADFIRADR